MYSIIIFLYYIKCIIFGTYLFYFTLPYLFSYFPGVIEMFLLLPVEPQATLS